MLLCALRQDLTLPMNRGEHIAAIPGIISSASAVIDRTRSPITAVRCSRLKPEWPKRRRFLVLFGQALGTVALVGLVEDEELRHITCSDLLEHLTHGIHRPNRVVSIPVDNVNEQVGIATTSRVVLKAVTS